VNVILLQFNLMFLHTRVVFSYFGYPSRIYKWYIWQKQILSSTHPCLDFFLFNRFIIDCEILPFCNSLLICKCVEKTNYQNDKQECSISIITSIKAMLFSKPSGYQVDKWSRHCRIIRFHD
jgi:hypothetical protein